MKILHELKNDGETRCFFFWFGLIVTALAGLLSSLIASCLFFLPETVAFVLCWPVICSSLGFLFACLVTHDTRGVESRQEIGTVLLVCTFYPITWLYVVITSVFPLFSGIKYCFKSIKDTLMYVFEGKVDE